MTAYAGTLDFDIVLLPGNPLFDGMYPYPSSPKPVYVLEAFEGDADRASRFPHPSSPTVPRIGVYEGGFDDIWYNTVHINPSPLQMGVIVPGSLQEVEVWNAFFTTKDLTNVSADAGLLGLTVTGEFATPTTFGILEDRIYSVSADDSGLAANQGTVTFTFSGVDYYLPVSATRAFVVSFPPDWAQKVKDSWEWYTEILVAYDGKEQRVKLRSKPRRTITYSTLVIDRMARAFDGTMFRAHKLPLAVPLWFDRDHLTSAVVPGQTSLSLDTTQHDYYSDGYLMLWAGWDSYELIQIGTVTDTAVTFKTPALGTWPAGTEVYPVRMCRAQQQLRVEKLTSNIGRALIVATAEEHEHKWAAVDSQATHYGTGVLEIEPNRVNSLEETWSSKQSILDFKTGARTVDVQSSAPVMTKTFEWFLNGSAAIKSHREWVVAREGRYNAVFVPTWNNDVKLAQDLTTGQTLLTVVDDNYRGYYDLANGKRDLFVLKKDGTTEFFRVTSAVQSATQGYEELQVDAGLGYQLNVADISMISLMGLHRLAADSVDYIYHTPTLATVSVNMRLLDE